MGFDLKPINKKQDWLRARYWTFMLGETGMGYVLGYGNAKAPGSYVYQTGGKGSPASNDGYKVTATEAKMMARVGRGYLSVQRYVNSEWEKLSEEERKQQLEAKMSDGTPLYKHPIGNEDLLSAIEKFCDWAETSKGFYIK